MVTMIINNRRLLPLLAAICLLSLLLPHPLHAQSSFTCQSACPDNGVQSLSYGGNVTITVLQAINLPNKDKFGPFSKKSDPYVKIQLGVSNGRSKTISNNLNPAWDEDLPLGVHLSQTSLNIQVWDADAGLEFGDDYLGSNTMKLSFCSMFTAPTILDKCGATNEWSHCAAEGSSWQYPIRQSCNETGWVALDGTSDSSTCGKGTKACLQIRINIIPFVVHIEHQYASGTLSTTAAGYSGSLGPTWATNFGYLFADATLRMDPHYLQSYPLVGGILVRTHTADKNKDASLPYIGLSTNFKSTIWVCRLSSEMQHQPAWLSSSEGWEETSFAVTYTGGSGLFEWGCYRKIFSAVEKNEFNYLDSEPIYLYGNNPNPTSITLTRQYIVVVVPMTAEDEFTVSSTYSNAFDRKAFWLTIGEFGVVFFLFAFLVYRYLTTQVNLRIDRIETQLMACAADLFGGDSTTSSSNKDSAGEGTAEGAAGEEDDEVNKPSANLLMSLFVSYNETKHNIEYRRNLYWATFATKLSLLFPLVILWLWGIVAITTVNPPAVGYGILLVGSMLLFGLYGFKLWQSQGWCMSPLAFNCLGVSAVCAICFLIVIIFANPAVMFGHESLDFLSLSAVFGTLNLIPLIFRAFSNDKTLARSVNQLLSSVNVAAKSLKTGGKGAKQDKKALPATNTIAATKALIQAGSNISSQQQQAMASPVNTLLGSCYTIHVSVPYFKQADMVAVILKRCTGAISKMSNGLYLSSVALLLIYATIASVITDYLALGWANLFCLLFFDTIHYLLSRGADAWAPGHGVAILSAGRLLITIICGEYWLMGYSLAYMVYGYALTDAIITKHLPHMSKAEAGAVAFFGFDSFLKTNVDMASTPEFGFGFLSFGFLALLLAVSFTKPTGFPLPSILVGGTIWPSYVFGLAAFLFILITCLVRATFRAFYLHREDLLMGSLRDTYFWSSGIRIPIVLAVMTQVLVICAGLLIYAATRASIIFVLSIFLPPVTIAGAYLYSKWVTSDYTLIIWPPLEDEASSSKKPGGDDVADDSELAFATIGSLFGPASPTRTLGSNSGQGFTIDLSKSSGSTTTTTSSPNKKGVAIPTSAAAALGGAGGGGGLGDGLKFDLPPLVKTGRDGLGEIKMPALPLKANFKKKDKEIKDEGPSLDDSLVASFLNPTAPPPLSPPSTNETRTSGYLPGGGEIRGGKTALSFVGEEAYDSAGKLVKTGGKDAAGPPGAGTTLRIQSPKRRPRFREAAANNPVVLFLAKRCGCCMRAWKRGKIAAKAAELEEAQGSEEREGLLDVDLSKLPFGKAMLEGYLTDEEYLLLLIFVGLLVLIIIMGCIIARWSQPGWMGHLLWSMSISLLFTVLPIIKWFNTYELDRTTMAQIGTALLLFGISLIVFFERSLEADLNNPASLWVLTAFIYYPVFVVALVQFIAWKDNGWKITSIDQDGDGDVSITEIISYVNITPFMIGLAIVFIWEISIFASRTAGILLVLVFVLSLIGFVFLRDWAKHDFYLSPTYQMLGNRITQLGMFISMAVALVVDADLVICLSMFFFLYILRDITSIVARRFTMEPDVPIYISPYIFPIYSYCSRTNDLINETAVGIRLYSAMIMTILWGICFAIFITPQYLGVAIACIAIIATVVITAVLIEQVPLALGSSSRFLGAPTITEAAEIAKAVFAKRRKPVEFECSEWNEVDKTNPLLGRQDQNASGQENDGRRSAAELANEVASRITSLRNIRNRRGEERIHTDAVYATQDALAEAALTGRGPLGILNSCCCCCGAKARKMIFRNYDEEGRLLRTEKLKRRFDPQRVLVGLKELDGELSHEFYEELRCVIHLWLLLIVAADARLRREKVLFQKFLRENRFKLLSNGIAPPKNIFSSASFASINIPLVAVWLSTLTPEERERFHLLKSKFSEEQATRDVMVDSTNAEMQAEADTLLQRRLERQEEMSKRRLADLMARRERRLARWQSTLQSEEQRRFQKYKPLWLKGTTTRVSPEDEAMYRSFLEIVTIQGGDEALECARDALQEIESAAKDCRQGQFGRAFQYYDPEFQIGPSSLGKDPGIDPMQLTWQISLSMNGDCVLFDDGTDPDDVFKGKLNDGWLLGAISMLAAAGGVGDGGVDEQVQQLFVGFPIDNGRTIYRTSVGAYGVRLFKNGQWETVIVDDFFPVIKLPPGEAPDPTTRGAAFAYTKGFKELWVPLIEKAFAKYYGSYSELQAGHVHHALHDLTGCEAEEVHLSKASRGVGKRSLWDLVVRCKKNGYILGAGSISSTLADREILDTGLVFGAAYTIYDAKQVDEYQLIKLRNPPGDHEEWKGDWGDKSTLWNKRYRKKLGFTDEDDNTFWMSFDDFCMAFNSLYICRWYNTKTWKSQDLYGCWKVAEPTPKNNDNDQSFYSNNEEKKEDYDTSGGLPSKHNPQCQLEHNPQYQLMAHRKTDVKITLAQTDASGLGNAVIHPVAMYLLNQTAGVAAAASGRGKKQKGGSKLVKAITLENMYSSTGAPVREKTLSLYASLEPGTYTLLAATYLAGMEGLFTIKVVSNWSLVIDRKWPPVAKEATFSEKLMSRTIRVAEQAHDELLGQADDVEAPAAPPPTKRSSLAAKANGAAELV